ncbi:MAG: hypothetical protein PHT30_04465 [Bacilli bacterium]|jgi:hypothetical protein|nr:hypothetical protein [Bacilli bacterium]
MANFYRTLTEIGYLEINDIELINYSNNGYPICGECQHGLVGEDDIILIPILNEAYCNECGKKVLKTIVDYPEDRDIRIKRENFYKNYWQLEG